MVDSRIQPTLTRPQVFLWWMIIFLILIAFVGAILHEQIWQSFLNNPALNGLIAGVLLFGIVYTFNQVLGLLREIRWVNTFRNAEGGPSAARQPILLAPMAAMLRDRRGLFSLSPTSTRSILDSIATRLDEARDTSRYLVGLLIFLGLLGTFWGLLETIGSVGSTIAALDTGPGDSLIMFEELKAGLEAPLSGMGTAFSSSLFGLSGSLVLGFLDLQTAKAQNRFYTELENWLASATELGIGEGGERGSEPEIRFALLDVQRSITDLGDRIEKHSANDNSDQSAKELVAGIKTLIEQLHDNQKIVREWADQHAEQNQNLVAAIKEISDSAKILSGTKDEAK